MLLPELDQYRTHVLQEEQFQVLQNSGHTISYHVIADPQITVCGTLGCKRILRQVAGETRIVYCPMCNAEAESLKIRMTGYLEHSGLELQRQQAVRSNTYYSTEDDVSPRLPGPPPQLHRQVACWEPLSPKETNSKI